jgi:hypothetical protein
VLAQLQRCAADTRCAWIIASHESLGAASDQASQLVLTPL